MTGGPWQEPRLVRDRATLPEQLILDMDRWTQTTTPQPAAIPIRMCGCDDGPFDTIALCGRHEGYLAALEVGYADGYTEALDAVDSAERRSIAAQEHVPIDGLSAPVQVPLWVTLYAIRYGVVRQSYANGDAALLAQEFWNQYPTHIQDQIRADAARVNMVDADAWDWLHGRT